MESFNRISSLSSLTFLHTEILITTCISTSSRVVALEICAVLMLQEMRSFLVKIFIRSSDGNVKLRHRIGKNYA